MSYTYICIHVYVYVHVFGASIVAQSVRNPPAMQETLHSNLGSSPESERSPREENGNPLQYSCLENPKDRGAWWATVHGVRKSQAWPSTCACTHTCICQAPFWVVYICRLVIELTRLPCVCQAPFTDRSFRFLNNLFYKQKSKVRVDLLAFICSCFTHVFQYRARWWFLSSSRPIGLIPTEAHSGPQWEGWQARWKVRLSGQQSALRESEQSVCWGPPHQPQASSKLCDLSKTHWPHLFVEDNSSLHRVGFQWRLSGDTLNVLAGCRA